LLLLLFVALLEVPWPRSPPAPPPPRPPDTNFISSVCRLRIENSLCVAPRKAREQWNALYFNWFNSLLSPVQEQDRAQPILTEVAAINSWLAAASMRHSRIQLIV
jgi:hypothetical protein